MALGISHYDIIGIGRKHNDNEICVSTISIKDVIKKQVVDENENENKNKNKKCRLKNMIGFKRNFKY